jgi:hypothetical protein
MAATTGGDSARQIILNRAWAVAEAVETMWWQIRTRELAQGEITDYIHSAIRRAAIVVKRRKNSKASDEDAEVST